MAAQTQVYIFTASVPVPAGGSRHEARLLPELRPAPTSVAGSKWEAERVEERRAEGHAKRIHDATVLYDVTLDPARSRFGARSVAIAGQFESDSPDRALRLVLDLLRWTLARVYRVSCPDSHHSAVPLEALRLSIRTQPSKPDPAPTGTSA